MPGCAAIGCNNRSEKGHRMKCFPRDPKLRKIWQERVGRADWKPSNNSFLCHEHFESDNWCIMENGRVKLKKDAIPSIFTITSTRKSIKKRIKITDDNNENNCEIEYSMINVENDREHSSIDYLEEKYSDSQDIDVPSTQLFAYQQTNNFSKSVENKPSAIQHYDFQQENILISDDSIKKEVIKLYNVEKQEDGKDKKPIIDFVSNVADNSNETLKPELKEAVQISVRPYNYDEIEEKLKQICDGYFEENNSNNIEKPHSISDNQTEVLQQASNKTPVHRSINYKHSSGNNIGHMLTNDAENIEIIFSAENGEEDTHVRKSISHNNDVINETEMLVQRTTGIDNSSNDKEIEQHINVTPNIRAAMKRKRKTRDEIMKSIEKSICNISSQDTNSLSDSDTFDDTLKVEDQRKKIQKTRDDSGSDVSPTTTRFTVKVTGHPNDVSDIMHDLSGSIEDTSFQEYNDVSSPKEDNGFVTSVITIDDCLVDVDDKVEFQDDDPLLSCMRDVISNDRILPSTSKNCRCLNTKITSHSDEELNDLTTNNSRLIPAVKNATQLLTNNCALKCEYEKLQRKLSVQANVVKELSNQLISCKRVEQALQNKNSTLERKIQSMTNELNDVSSPTRMRGNVKQKLVDDLINKLSNFEEANKKLVKSASVGVEQMKKLESQIKQRDNRIKELNWKLDKASKYLERAEKNTNTYRKKMLNLQGLLRRKKLLEDKMTKFNKILVDTVKKSYTTKILPITTAMKILQTCGTTEYDKLLQSGFPLPALSAVRIVSDNLSDSDESTHEILRADTSGCDVNKVCDMQCARNHVEVESKNVESVGGEITLDDTETVMGTVQDIFDECSDDDDFSTNEWTEHFISQLNKFM